MCCAGKRQTQKPNPLKRAVRYNALLFAMR